MGFGPSLGSLRTHLFTSINFSFHHGLSSLRLGGDGRIVPLTCSPEIRRPLPTSLTLPTLQDSKDVGARGRNTRPEPTSARGGSQLLGAFFYIQEPQPKVTSADITSEIPCIWAPWLHMSRTGKATLAVRNRYCREALKGSRDAGTVGVYC